MEHISPKATRPRGRPRKAEAFMWDIATKMEGRPTSHRHRAHFLSGVRTMTVLGTDLRFAWLSTARCSTIVNELGRIDDDQNLIAMALSLCDLVGAYDPNRSRGKRRAVTASRFPW
jgi:hypothetical protein